MAARFVFLSLLVLGVYAPQLPAALVWTINSSESFIRLNIPDQPVPLDEEATVVLNAKLRDYQVDGGPLPEGDPNIPSQWSDGNGRASNVTGILNTNYSEGSSIQFLAGTHSASAIEYGAFHPVPNDPFDPDATAPAAFAADIWADAINEETEINEFLRAGQVRISNIAYDLDGTATLGAGPPGTWTQTGGSIDLGILTGGVADLSLFDGAITLFDEELGAVSAVNLGAIEVDNLGGLDRRLTITVNVPVAIDVGPVPLTAYIEGVIVAYSTVPEPSSALLISLALGLVTCRRNRAGYR